MTRLTHSQSFWMLFPADVVTRQQGLDHGEPEEVRQGGPLEATWKPLWGTDVHMSGSQLPMS